MTPNSHESSTQVLLRLQLSLVPCLLSPWRPKFPFSIILRKLCYQPWSSFFPIDLKKAYLSSSPLWVFSDFFFFLESGHGKAAAESCMNSKEASGTLISLCCMSLSERLFRHCAYKYTYIHIYLYTHLYNIYDILYIDMFSSLYNKHISTQQPSLMSFTALSVMETRESSLLAGTIHPGCSKITLSGERGTWMQKPRKRPIWLGHCLLSRLELNHGTFQLPGALQMKKPSKHDNKRKLGRWLPREGRTGASTEHVQTLRSWGSPLPKPSRPLPLLCYSSS